VLKEESKTKALASLQNEYLSLVEQCMNFACELMDLCRGTQEVEAVLSEGGEDNGAARDPLGRLKMAMEYEEKKVSPQHCLVHVSLLPRYVDIERTTESRPSLF
jgi:hypothetical protein